MKKAVCFTLLIIASLLLITAMLFTCLQFCMNQRDWYYKSYVKYGTSRETGISDEDIVSVRIGEFGADVMIRNRINSGGKYSRFIINNTTLDEILLFYVRKGQGREWSV